MNRGNTLSKAMAARGKGRLMPIAKRNSVKPPETGELLAPA
jgi:hypothetical protein